MDGLLFFRQKLNMILTVSQMSRRTECRDDCLGRVESKAGRRDQLDTSKLPHHHAWNLSIILNVDRSDEKSHDID